MDGRRAPLQATSFRNEIPVRRGSLLDAAAATNSDPRLCVVIEQFYQKKRSCTGVYLRTLKHTNLVISDTREWNCFLSAFRMHNSLIKAREIRNLLNSISISVALHTSNPGMSE